MLRFHLLLLTALLLPSASLAQNVILRAGGFEYPAQAATFGSQLFNSVNIGPVLLWHGLDTESNWFDGCEPLVNTDVLAGAIVSLERGTCSFAAQAQHASASEAIAVIVYGDQEGDDSLVTMGGDCSPEKGCSIPAVYISRRSFDLILVRSEIKGWIEATIIPNFSVAAEEITQAGTYQLDSIYPNPASTTATAGFTLPTAEQALGLGHTH